MIQFLTLVLSLQVGILPVQVAVAEPVAHVEIYLNGHLVDERSAPPWTFQVDLGRELPRAVVLVLSRNPQSYPALSFQQAQDYLRSLRVPLLVWAPTPKTYERLGITPQRSYAGGDGLVTLFEDLEALIDQQTMVWIEGEHLPTEITLNAAAPEGVELLR